MNLDSERSPAVVPYPVTPLARARAPIEGTQLFTFPNAYDLAARPFEPDAVYVVRSLNATANKPLHIGHLRNLVLGAATSAALRTLGARVIRHCIVEDTGRSMCEAMAALAGNASNSPLKPDHFIGAMYTEYHRTHSNAPDRGYDAPNDEADELMRALLRNEPPARALWARARALALEGQQETLQRLGISFDHCDYESAEDAAMNAFIADARAAGVFTRMAMGHVAHIAPSGHLVRILNQLGLPEENARLLSFLQRLYKSWPPRWINIVMAGSEWKDPMALYPDILEALGIRRSDELYALTFYGMVLSKGQKMASSSGKGVLIDDLLNAAESSEAALRFRSDSGFAPIVVKSFLLATPRTENVDFDPAHVCDASANVGWRIAAAWRALAGGRSAPGSDRARSILLDAVSRTSYERAVTFAGELADAVIAGQASDRMKDDFRFLVAALSLTPERSDFVFAHAASLIEARDAAVNDWTDRRRS